MIGTFIVVDEDKIIFQRAKYIDDGWYVVMKGNKFTLFEIPTGGGEPIKIGVYDNLFNAIKDGEDLT